jgi:hypothetical protein
MQRIAWTLPLAIVFATNCKTTQTDSISELHSDHIDGPATTAHAISDMVDFFIFPTPEKEGYVTMVLNVHPLSREHNHFSDKVDYSFYLRKVKIKKNGTKTELSTEDNSEKVITCRFTTPHDHTKHTMTCTLPGIGAETVTFNDPATATPDGKIRLYHGLRSDPFFFNSDFATSLASEGKKLEPKDNNVMANTNALTVIVQFNPKDMFGSDLSLLGVAVQSHTKGSNGEFQTLDRIGRPEVTNITMVARANAQDLRDQYNLERPFKLSAPSNQLYRERIINNLGHYDAVDGKVDWTPIQKQEYAEIIVNDFLLIDVSKTNQGGGYFAIESALLAGKPHTSFGGRRLQDDIMDTLFGILINRNGQPVADGVNKPDQPIKSEFPYLADPDMSWAGWAKAKLARWKLGGVGHPN